MCSVHVGWFGPVISRSLKEKKKQENREPDEPRTRSASQEEICRMFSATLMSRPEAFFSHNTIISSTCYNLGQENSCPCRICAVGVRSTAPETEDVHN